MSGGGAVGGTLKEAEHTTQEQDFYFLSYNQICPFMVLVLKLCVQVVPHCLCVEVSP